MVRRLAAATLLSLATVAGTSALAATTAAHVSVTPTTGPPTTRFRVGFTAPASSGRAGSMMRRYDVHASTRPARGCVAAASAPVGDAFAGHRVHVTLAPGVRRRWCPGPYSGRVEETVTPVCGFRQLCPNFVAILTVGRFTFRVRSVVPARG